MRNERGFTLVEVLISVLILAMTGIALFYSWSGSTNALRKSRVYNNVYLLLQRRVAEFETDMKDKTVDDLKDDDKGDFGSDYPDYTWEVKSQPFVLPALIPTNDKNGNKNEIMETVIKTLSAYFEKAVREVAVTVIYKRSGKELRYTVNTIFVDYTKELPSAF